MYTCVWKINKFFNKWLLNSYIPPQQSIDFWMLSTSVLYLSFFICKVVCNPLSVAKGCLVCEKAFTSHFVIIVAIIFSVCGFMCNRSSTLLEKRVKIRCLFRTNSMHENELVYVVKHWAGSHAIQRFWVSYEFNFRIEQYQAGILIDTTYFYLK